MEIHPPVDYDCIFCCMLKVYELLDVLESSGPLGLAEHVVPHISWEEVQAMTGPGTVSLPLGYKPDVQQKLLGKPAMLAGLPASSAASSTDDMMIAAAQASHKLLLEGAKAAFYAEDEAIVAAADVSEDVSSLEDLQTCRAGGVVAVEAVHELTGVGGMEGAALGWRQRGWKRSQYLAAAAGMPAQ
jgi:hypothetical protein